MIIFKKLVILLIGVILVVKIVSIKGREILDMTPLGGEEGKKIKYKATSKISTKMLDSGYYLGMTAINDQRGDEYYSQVVGYDISLGKLKKVEIDETFYGRAY